VLAKTSNRFPGKIAPTCFADFNGLTKAVYLLPTNPSRITGSVEATAHHVILQSGHEKFITPAQHLYAASGWPARRVRRVAWEIEFPDVLDQEFVRQLRLYQDQGKNIGIWVPSASPNAVGGSALFQDRDLMWTDGNGYFYTAVWPFVESSLVLYDRNGTKIYEYGGRTGTTNTYNVTVDASFGRVYFPSSVPELGEVYAEYEHLFYGKITDLPMEPMPWGERARFPARITLHEAAYPVVTRTFRLHLGGTAPTGITSGDVDPDTPEASATEYGQTTPVLGGLTSALPGQYINSQNVTGDGTDRFDSWGSYVSYPLAEQILPAGTVCDVGGCEDAVATQGLTLCAFVYVWRPGVGRVATLSASTYEDDTLEEGSPQDGAGTAYIWAEANCDSLKQPVHIQYGDRIVVELWGKYDHSGAADLNFAGGEKDAQYTKGNTVGAGDYALWVQFEDPIYLFEE